jgi:hypothetical protein
MSTMVESGMPQEDLAVLFCGVWLGLASILPKSRVIIFWAPSGVGKIQNCGECYLNETNIE